MTFHFCVVSLLIGTEDLYEFRNRKVKTKKKSIEANEEKEENIFVNLSARAFPFTFICYYLLLSTGNTNIIRLVF